MRKYIVKRLLLSVMFLFCVSFIIYTLMRCLPGSFVETRAMQLSQGAGAKSYDERSGQTDRTRFCDLGRRCTEGQFRRQLEIYGTGIGQIQGSYLAFLCDGRDFLCITADHCDPVGGCSSNEAVFQSGLPDHSRCIDGYFAADLLFCDAVKAAVLRKAGLV